MQRNKIKRLIREAYRLNKSDFIVAINEKHISLHIAITYVADKETDFTLIQEKVRLILSKILVATTENHMNK
ncbi:hypothetical protein SDC9_154182 [bioreactor metagenome]|uniref:Uncharacterized protein n=1 Tax=bioreactor metagenome TaxID=1076179 RepID=A0A645EY05_9ZZZZ